jgi:ATPase family associated with various cellular activities (AAA)
MRQLLAAWMVIDKQDVPMNPRLLGKPGVGKTTLAYAAAKRLKSDVDILQATVDAQEVTERHGATTFKGNPLTLLGPELKPGDQDIASRTASYRFNERTTNARWYGSVP